MSAEPRSPSRRAILRAIGLSPLALIGASSLSAATLERNCAKESATGPTTIRITMRPWGAPFCADGRLVNWRAARS